MAHLNPIGLLSIHREKEVVKAAVYQFYQNAVDYLNRHAQMKGWEAQAEENTYKTPTGYLVSVQLMIPSGIDLNQETYLDGEETKSAEG